MTLNCKADDLVMVVRPLRGVCPHYLGLVRRAVAPELSVGGEPGWLFDVPIQVKCDCLFGYASFGGMADKLLRPLRDEPDPVRVPESEDLTA